MDDCCRIEKVQNGYCVEIKDPTISKANKPSKNGELTDWKDPWVEYCFGTVEEVVAFLTKALPKCDMETDEYASAFDKCCSEAEDD